MFESWGIWATILIVAVFAVLVIWAVRKGAKGTQAPVGAPSGSPRSEGDHS